METVGFPVAGIEIKQRIEDLPRGLDHPFNVCLRPSEPLFGCDLLAADPFLLALELVRRKRVVIEKFHQLFVFAVQSPDRFAVAPDLGLVDLAHPRHRDLHGLPHVCQVEPPDAFGCAFAELLCRDPLVCVYDFLLDLMGGQVRQLAAGPLETTETGEVVVDPPGLALSFDEGDAFAALTAQASLEVMAVLTVPLSRVVVSIKNLLDLGEGLGIGQRIVPSWELKAAVFHDPHVVLGSQYPMELGSGERLRRVFARRPRPQAALL
ncbi:MAG TPA: hypothetical protein VI039_01300 [Solirubrobacterales bacterium]